MILYDVHFQFPKIYKEGQIGDNIHYRINSDLQNKRWFVAITTYENNVSTSKNEPIVRHELSKICNNYGEVIHYLPSVVAIINHKDLLQEATKVEHRMKEDFDNICITIATLEKEILRFKKNYIDYEKDREENNT